MTLELKTEEREDTMIVSLIGNLIDQQQSEEIFLFWEKEMENGRKKFIVDMSDAKYMNSTGLNILINLLTKTRNNGGEVILTNLSEKIKELYMITKLDSIFTITDNLDDAVKKFEN